MGTTRIYHEEEDRYYNVNYDLYSSSLNDGDGAIDYYILVTTDMRMVNGDAFPTFRIRTLEDVPPGGTPASTFTGLLNDYISWFMEQAELGLSSSSSSSSTSSSSSVEISSSLSSTSSSGVAPSESSSSSESTPSSYSSDSTSYGSSSSSSENAVYEVSGITSPVEYNGLYWDNGLSEGVVSYKNKDGYYLYNDAVLGQQYWFISAELGVGDPVGEYFATDAAGAITDAYTGYNGATGTAAVILAPHI
ncbi:MAG: hypothetical protein WC375_03665 [Methanomassiliicoccales archaeon]|jgi:hypothetical protein